MVIPFGALEVAHLVHQGLQAVVHVLWILPLAKPEETELPLDRLSLGDFGHLISFVRGLEYFPNLFGTFQSLHLVILLST
jgi:predicted phosphoribosyltransferase